MYFVWPTWCLKSSSVLTVNFQKQKNFTYKPRFDDSLESLKDLVMPGLRLSLVLFMWRRLIAGLHGWAAPWVLSVPWTWPGVVWTHACWKVWNLYFLGPVTSWAELACSADILRVKPTSEIQVVTFSLPRAYEWRREHCESELSRLGHERKLGTELLKERISILVLCNYVFLKN